MSDHTPVEIVVVGGGASGVLVAARILDASVARAVRVRIVERSSRPAAGVAYGTDDPDHLLNVRAGGMSADPSHPGDFTAWVATRQLGGQSTFVARRHYRAYLQEHLAAAANAAADGRVDIVHDTATGIEPTGDRAEVLLASGSRLGADRVVLALGNPPPGTPHPLQPLVGHPRWVGDPWAPRALDPAAASGEVVLVGSGLTMVDVAIAVSRHDAPRMLALSRHGLLPLPHVDALAPRALDVIDLDRDGDDLLTLVRRIRTCAAVPSDGADWRDVVDSVRPYVNALWRRASSEDRQAFLAHLSRFWDIHRHRMAPATGARLESLLGQGRLGVHAGRVLAAEQEGDRIRLTARIDGEVRRLRPDLVVNCTGPGRAWEPPANPLVIDLIRRGLATPDPHRLGLATTDDGRLLDASGSAVDPVLVIGPLRRGSLLETTAIPELRSQALHIADHIVLAPVP